jgi:hypothetical protein
MKLSTQYRAIAECAKRFLVVVTSALVLASVEVALGAPPPPPPPIEVQRPKIPVDVQRPRIPLESLQTPLVQQPAISGGAFACMADAGDPGGLTNRDLAGALFRGFKDNTNQACRSTCEQRGFPFAATQGGSHCFCGNTYGKYGAAAPPPPPRSCNLGCVGNPNEICGGEWANSVSLTGVTPPPPTDGGQCLVKAQGGYTRTGGAAGSYNSVELHRWDKLATTASTSTNKTYTFRYTMTASGYMDQTGAGGQWRGTWGGTLTRAETWQGVATTNPTTGQPAWRLRTAQGFATTMPYTGHLLNPLQPDPKTSVQVRTFAYPLDVWSTGSSYVFPATTGTTTQAVGVVWLWNNPLGNATYTCSWNVTL